ncbi:MAG TPA: response regulator transcription factor [Caldilineaceae bacterium]|nr:response regulator transcription factor [Caldilineaceae bacterium]
MTIRIVLADEQKLMRHGLRILLEQEPELEVVGEAESQAQTIGLTLHLEPDIVLLDIAISGQPDIGPVTEILRQRPQTGILILTDVDDHEVVLQALWAGAVGYLLKTVAPAELVKALYAIISGGTPLDPHIANIVIRRFCRPPLEPEPSIKLTARECEVLDLLGQGCSNAEIADRLVITQYTVRAHISRVYKKLNLPNRTKAALYLMRQKQSQGESDTCSAGIYLDTKSARPEGEWLPAMAAASNSAGVR